MSAQENTPLNAAIRDNMISWAQIEEQKQGTQLTGSIWTSSLTQISRTKLPTSETAKYSQRIFAGNIYWNGVNYKENDNIGHIFTINDIGQEIQVDQSLKSINPFSVFGNNVLWQNSSYQLIKLDMENNVETLIYDSGWAFGEHIATVDKVYFSDSSGSPNPDYGCGFSIIAYNLSTLEKKIVKANVGLTDYFLEDIWEDWMVYVNCNEGGTDLPEQFAQCCSRAHGDVFLHHLPTGQEWSLTNIFSDQVNAKMWGLSSLGEMVETAITAKVEPYTGSTFVCILN